MNADPILSLELAAAKRRLKELVRDNPACNGIGSDGISLRVYILGDIVPPDIPLTVDGFEVRRVFSGVIRAQA
jgi:hypothetical protein